MDKRGFTTALGKYLVNPIVKAAVALRLAPPSYACASTVLSCRSWAPTCSPSGSTLIPKRLVAAGRTYTIRRPWRGGQR
jgi:hypothetical protein